MQTERPLDTQETEAPLIARRELGRDRPHRDNLWSTHRVRAPVMDDPSPDEPWKAAIRRSAISAQPHRVAQQRGPGAIADGGEMRGHG